MYLNGPVLCFVVRMKTGLNGLFDILLLLQVPMRDQTSIFIYIWFTVTNGCDTTFWSIDNKYYSI